MSQRIYYEIDGHVRGPISLTQLQLMATSGMLLPHHRLRREDTEEWFPAQSVRGLFSDPMPAPAVPVGGVVAEVAATPVQAAEEIPFGGYTPSEPEFNAAFDFFSESEPAAAKDPNEPIDLPEVEAAADQQPPAPPPKSAPAKRADAQPETKTTAKSDTAAPAAQPSPAVEVAGQAVEILPDDSIRLLDGKTTFRLHRVWLQAASKFADGTSRTVYLRLARIDAGMIDQRPSQTRGKNGPMSILSFAAGNARVGLVIQGSEKLYRAFLEKTLLVSSTGASTSKATGKT